MEKKPEQLYLNLIKKTLSFTLWLEPPQPAVKFNYVRSPLKRLAVSAVSKILEPTNLDIVQDLRFSEEDRENGTVWPWPGYADTMIGLKCLDNLQYCVETCIKEEVEGDMIETGVWRGGACIFMRAILAAYGVTDRKIFVADSFEGLPEPDAEKYPEDKGDEHYTHNTFLAVFRQDVENNFKRYDLLDEQVVFLQGWFKDSLPNAPIEKLSVLRLDGDMYESTIDSLNHLYPKLSKGGFCIIDDYNIKNCVAAVNDYRKENNISDELVKVDKNSVYWRR